MSLYYQRGGFKAASRTLTTTNHNDFDIMAGHLMMLVLDILEASRLDATARQASYTQYWDFDSVFLDYCAQGMWTNTVTYNAYDLTNADDSIILGLRQFTETRQSMRDAFAVRAHDNDASDAYPAIATMLRGQNDELLYICMSAGVTIRFNETNDPAFGLNIHCNNAHGYGKVSGNALVSMGGLHIWYQPSPEGSSTISYAMGAPHPGRANFLTDHTMWCIDSGWCNLNISQTPATVPNLRNSSAYKHIALCKEDILLLGVAVDSGTSHYSWVTLGKNLIESATDNNVALPGLIPLQTQGSENLNPKFLHSDSVLNASSADVKYGDSYSYAHAKQSDNSSTKAIRFVPILATNVLYNRLSSDSDAIIPIGIYALPPTSVSNLNSYSVLAGNGQSLVGFIRGDIVRGVCGWGLSLNGTFDNGNYIIQASAGTSAYSASSITNAYRILIGWDSSNEVVL